MRGWGEMDDATYTFDASYDEEGAALAERYFYLRTIRERRPWSTFGPPIFWVLVLVIANAVEAPAWFLIFALVAFALSAAGPAFFYLARPLEARQIGRAHV